MANAPPNQKDDKDKTTGKDEEVKPYLQPLIEELNKLTLRKPPNYAKLMVWAVCVALLTLVALPLGALWISSNSFCCFDNNSLQNQLTFWAAMLGGFIALFGIVISGLFVVFALRIDHGAALEASRYAVKAAIEFIDFDPKRLLEKFEERTNEFSSLVKEKEEKIEKKIDEAKEKIDKAKKDIDGSINAFCSKKKDWDEKAEEIEQSLPAIKDRLDKVKQEVDAKSQQLIEETIADLKTRSNSAMQDIEVLVANVQQAADEATRKLQSETPGDGQEPRS